MILEPLVFVGTCDLAGLVRGKAVPEAELPTRIENGVGWTPANIMMSPFGPIYEMPFGTSGDLRLMPDPTTRVEVEFGDDRPAERFCLADIMTMERQHWACCPRDFLRRGLTALDAAGGEAGLTLLAAFEQEFVYTGVEDRPGATYALDAFRRQGKFGETYIAALRAAGLQPDSFMAEYGARMYEVTIAPSRGMRAADEAVIQREMARATAQRFGHRAIFSPILDPDGTGNGTHIHFSLRDGTGHPVFYDPDRPYRLSQVGEHFVAGLLHHLPVLTAIAAPSVASYYRLRPNRWAPTSANIGVQEREAAIRVCPIFGTDAAASFNVEYRVADAAASPYLALGAMVWAGVDGIRQQRRLPPPDAAPAETPCLPRSLGEALDLLAASRDAREWLGATLFDAYLRFKRAELRVLDGLTETEICARYAEVY